MRLSAEVKLTWLAIFSILIVLSFRPYHYAVLASALILSIMLIRPNIASIRRMMLLAIPFIIIISTVQGLLTGEGPVLWSIWIFKVTSGGIYSALESAARMGLLYVAGSAVTVTTTETEFSRAIEKFLSPVSRATGSNIGRDISTMMMLAVAFLPMVYEEYNSIKMAQEARGVSFKGPVNAIRGVFSVAVPMLYALSNRADSVALAMEARCYGIRK